MCCNHPRNWRRKNRITYQTEALLQSSLSHPEPVELIVERWTSSHGRSRQGDKHRHASGHVAGGKPWRHRIPEFVFLRLPVLISRDESFFLPISIIETLLFVATVPFTVCYKCLWSETELFLWLWLHNIVILVCPFREWRGAQVRVLEDCSHVTSIWLVNALNQIFQCLDLGSTLR